MIDQAILYVIGAVSAAILWPRKREVAAPGPSTGQAQTQTVSQRTQRLNEIATRVIESVPGGDWVTGPGGKKSACFNLQQELATMGDICKNAPGGYDGADCARASENYKRLVEAVQVGHKNGLFACSIEAANYCGRAKWPPYGFCDENRASLAPAVAYQLQRSGIAGWRPTKGWGGDAQPPPAPAGQIEAAPAPPRPPVMLTERGITTGATSF